MNPYVEISGFFNDSELSTFKTNGWNLISAGPPTNQNKLFCVLRIDESYEWVFPKDPCRKPSIALETGGPGGLPCEGRVEDPRMT